MNIILIGPPASGKGTVAEHLVKKFKLFPVNTGSLLRTLSKERKDIAKIVNSGELVNDDLALELIKEYLTSQQVFDNIMIDGTPRTLYQYEELKKWLTENHKKFDLALYMKVSDEEVIKRISNRRSNAKTGEIYNLLSDPPPEDIDPKDLVQREDDTPQVIKHRLEVYHSTTEPLLEILRNDGILHEINADQPIEDMNTEAEIVVNNYLKQQNA